MRPSLRSFRVLTFDVVGTLIDFGTGVLEAVRRHSGRDAAVLPDDAIFRSYLRGREIHALRSSEAFAGVYRHMAEQLGLPGSDETADAFQLSVLRWPAFPDSAEALRRLRRRFRLVAMTNADRVAFAGYAHRLGNPFHDSLTYDDTGVGKPDPRFFAFNQGRQSLHGFRQNDILHVAQSQHHDIGVARDLGYRTCWIERRRGQPGWGATPAPDAVTTPDFHFATLAELADAVEAEG